MVLFWFFKNLFYIFWPPGDTSKVIALVKASITRVLHVCSCGQGAWGGSLLMSRRHRWKLDGVERQEEFYLFIFFVDETLMKDWNNDELNCVFFFWFVSPPEPILSHGTHTKWCLSLCSVQPCWSERRWGHVVNVVTHSHSHTGIEVSVVVCCFVSGQGLMQNCNQMHACYLFQQDKHYDLSYDTGDKALQCGRHVDIFKLWLMWRAKVRRKINIFY